MARDAIPILMNGGNTFGVPYNGFSVEGTIAAVPWRAEGDGPLGPDIPWRWTGADVILWGGSTASVLVFCVIGMCCFVKVSNSREQKKIDDLLKSDKRLLQDFILLDSQKHKHLLSTANAPKHSGKKQPSASHKDGDNDDDRHAIKERVGAP